MKLLKSLLLFVLLSPKLYAQIPFEIKGEVKNPPGFRGALNNGDTIFLSVSKLKKTFQSVIKNNTFNIKGEIAEPVAGMLELKGSGLKFFLDSSVYDVQLVLKEVSPKRFAYNTNIKTNSHIHNTWLNFANDQISLFHQKAAYLNKADSAQSPTIAAEYKRKAAGIDSAVRNAYKTLAEKENNNPVTPYLLPSAPNFSYKNYIALYNGLTFKIKSSIYGKELFDKLSLLKKLDGPNTISIFADKQSVFPLINVIDTLGKVTHFDQKFFKQQRFTLIEIWASWCGPCRLINIELRGNEDEYAKKGLKIIGFSLDNGIMSWKKAISDDKIKWPQYSDLKAINSPLAVFFDLKQIPANILVDQQGNIVARKVYGPAIDVYLK